MPIPLEKCVSLCMYVDTIRQEHFIYISKMFCCLLVLFSLDIKSTTFRNTILLR